MSNATEFVQALRKYGKHTIGSTSVHPSGVEYHHEHINMVDAPYFMEKLWKAATHEIYGSFSPYRELTIEGITYRYGRNAKKGEPPHRRFGCSWIVKHTNTPAA